MPIISGPRHSMPPKKRIKSMAVNVEDVRDAGYTARCELDTHADTTCMGKQFLFISDTGQYCSVSGFHDSFNSINDIPVACGATKWTNPENGQTYILYVNQGLYFGSSMDHSLINPNQIRHFGIEVSDDPFDLRRLFGINHPDMQLKFQKDGTTIYFETSLPSPEDLEDQSFTHVTLTDSEVVWDPQTVDLSSDRPYGDQRVNISVMQSVGWWR